MNITEFEYVLAVAELKSFSKAAKKLCVSQPALSLYIGKVEANIGGKLFDRSVTPIRLTNIGKQYVNYAKKLLTIVDEFQKSIDDINSINTGSLIIGSTSCFSACYLPKAIARFKKLYPNIEVKIFEGRVPDIEKMALDGEVDLFIAPPGIDENKFSVENIFSEKIYLAVPEDWRINKKYAEYAIDPMDIINNNLEGQKVTDLSEFCDLPFVSLESDQHIYKVEQAIAEYYSKKIESVIRVSQMATSFAFANAGVGQTLTTETAIRYGNHQSFPKLYAVDPKIASRTMSAVYRKNSYRTKSCIKFIDIMKETL